MAAAVAAVEAEHGAVAALVNNAGYSQSGAFEAVPMERVRAQFETKRLRPHRADAARAPGDAPPAGREDREPQLDGREAGVPRRGLLPRDQARGRGPERRAPLRGARLRHPG